MPVIRLEDVSKFYKSEDKKDKRRYVAVQELNVSVEQGEFVFLIGSSGAGKTTMLKLMSGELPPDKGTVLLDDVNIARFFGPWKVRLARTFGVVSQQTMLIRKRTIMENLMMAGRASGMGRKSQAAAEKTLGLVGLPNVGSCYPAQLSIGEVRRVELARALISSPPILVLDELTANLDDDTIWDIFHLLNELNNKGTTIVMATHASQYVNIMRRRVITLVDGKVAGDVRNGKYGDIV
ncbi:MAG: ATP-binding cassette domain-containing protein [Lawsonibacter sp.]|jgi:cell division transport system ATP-binding protein|nr:ATP-binding cassette domain-containing protein [Lawsonibacter sp.]